MTTNAECSEATRFGTLRLTDPALTALGGLDGQAPGPLSPLARRIPGGDPGEPAALVAALQGLQGPWVWSVPALLDPGRTFALVAGDGIAAVLGQYLFPDPDALGPGFQAIREAGRIQLVGPLGLDHLRAGIFARLALEDVADPEPIRLELPSDHLAVLAACMDATRAAGLERRLRREGGAPAGVSAAQMARAWTEGAGKPEPGWTVSLLRLVAPGRMPDDLDRRLPGLLPELVRQDRLREISPSGATEPLYTLPPPLSPLLWGLSSTLNFGLVSQRRSDPRTVEATLLLGWRTPGGVWLADPGDPEDGQATLAFVGSDQVVDLIDEILGAEILGDEAMAPSWAEFSMETRFSRDALLARLGGGSAAGPPPPPLPPRRCPACGQPASAQARFCEACGGLLTPDP